MAQRPSTLPPLPEDLIPALRPILVAALEQSPQMILRNIDIAQAEASRMQSASVLWPRLFTSASYTDTESAVADVTSSSDGIFYSLSISQPVFHWGALKAEADKGKIGLKIAERQYGEGYRLLLVSLRRDFLALVTSGMALRNAELALKNAEENLALAEQKLRAGTISAEEITEPKLAVQEAGLARDRAVEDLEYAKRQFLLMAGQPSLNFDSILPAEVPAPVHDAAIAARLLLDFERDGINNTLSVLNYRDSIAQAGLDHKIAKFQLWPKFSFSASASEQNITSAGPGFVSTTAVGSQSFNLTASWSIFDGFSSRGSRLSALARQRSLERNLNSHTEQTVAKMRDMEKQLDFAWRLLELRHKRRDLGESGLNRLIANFKAGEAPQTAVAAGRLRLNRAEIDLSTARGDFLNRWSDYLSTLGEDPMLQTVPERYLSHGR